METTTAHTATAPDDQTARDQAQDHGPQAQESPRQGPHDQGSPGAGPSGYYGAGGPDWQQALRRPAHDRMLAGVAAGIARYLGVDAAIVRIVLVVLTFAGGAGLPLYLAGWLLIPEEGTDQSIASEFLSRPGHSR